jgi:hypothetical protein
VEVLEKGQVRSTRNRRVCMRNFMKVKAKGISAYPKGERAWCYVCSTQTQYKQTCSFILSFSYSYPTVGSVQHVSIMLQLFLRLVAWRQPSLKLEWMLTTANAAGTTSLKCLPKHGGARDNKFCSPIQWPLRMMLSFRNHTPTARPSSSSQTDMFMHTNVCTVRESNPRPLA